MKLGKGLLLVLALTLGVGSAFAQSIDVVADPAGTDCDGTFAPGAFATIYIIARPGPLAPDGITGAEFFVYNYPQTWSFAIVTPSGASNVALGNPILTSGGIQRANIAFPVCQPWVGGVTLLYTIQFSPGSVVGETYLQVGVANPPSNPTYTGPILTLCDPPIYTAVAVKGGAFIMNGRPCTVGVEQKTWGQVKALY